MAEENKKTEIENEENKTEKTELAKAELEKKVEEKPSKDKKRKIEIKKKEEAAARGFSLHLSMKQGKYICSFIKGKKIDQAIDDLEQVLKFKKAVPFKGEIPHRKGVGMMSGRYPINGSKLFIKLLKGLKGNIQVNNMDLDKTRIYIASASWASRPVRSGGREAKRTNIILKAKEFGDKK